MASLTIPDIAVATGSTSKDKVTGPEVARQELVYKLSLDLFRMDLHDFEQQHERVRRANNMLHDCIGPSMQAESEDMQVPSDALAYLQSQYKMEDSRTIAHLHSRYKMQDSRAVQLAHDKIDLLTLFTCKDITEYIDEMRQLKKDLDSLGVPLTDSRYIDNLIKGLPATYSSWVERYHDIVADPDASNPSLKLVEAQLMYEEATLPKTNVRKAKGNRDGKDNKDHSKYADGTIKPKCAYEPCGKWGHKEDNCFMKDPSKKKAKSANPPNKLNSASGTNARVTTTTTITTGLYLVDLDEFEQKLAEASDGWTTVQQR